MSTAKAICDKSIDDLSRRLFELTSLNLNRSLNSFYSDEINAKKSTLFEHPFFYPENRDWDGRFSFLVPTNDSQFTKVTSESPFSLTPVPDEDNIYLRVHPNECTQSGDLAIPSRDFMLLSYPWSQVFSKSDLDLIQKNNEILDFCQKILQFNPRVLYSDRKIDVCFFGLKNDPSRSFRDIMNIGEFVDILKCQGGISQAMAQRNFDFLAFKLVKDSRVGFREDSSTVSAKKIALKIPRKAKTFVVFIDSLDLGIFKDSSFSKGLVNLKSLINSSVVFENFTASGDWTYPCMHSLHTGVPIHYSFSNFRHDPILRNVSKEAALGQQKTLATHFITQSLYCNDSKISSDNFLTRVLAKNGISTAGIKSSRNHGWRGGLTHSLDVSFENCSINNIVSHFDAISSMQEIDTFFIDIDCLHRDDLYFKPHGRCWNSAPSEWVNDIPDKHERLLGVYEDLDRERRRYMDKMQIIDSILGDLLERIDENDNIVLFSDHGSQYFPWPTAEPYERHKDSTLSADRIWKPSLIVRAPSLKEFRRNSIETELVCTSDIYNIVKALHGLNTVSDLSCNLPLALGGSRPRRFATTLGLTVEANEERPELSMPKRFELVLRDGSNSGSIHYCPLEAKNLKDDSCENLFRKMFPSAASVFA